MNDAREPINQPSAPPPSYTESQSQHSSGATPNPEAPSVEIPPPYSPNHASNIAIENTGPGYQRFDVIDRQPQFVSIFQLGPSRCVVICPACGKRVTTVIHYVPGIITWLTACLFFFFCILCTFLPFCIPELQDVVHECPSCHVEIGVYRRM